MNTLVSISSFSLSFVSSLTFVSLSLIYVEVFNHTFRQSSGLCLEHPLTTSIFTLSLLSETIIRQLSLYYNYPFTPPPPPSLSYSPMIPVFPTPTHSPIMYTHPTLPRTHPPTPRTVLNHPPTYQHSLHMPSTHLFHAPTFQLPTPSLRSTYTYHAYPPSYPTN